MSQSPRSPSTHRKPQEQVRKGKGITGLGVSNVHPNISGRLTMAHLARMHKLRKNDMFEVEGDNDFDQVKQVVIQREKLKEKLSQV